MYGKYKLNFIIKVISLWLIFKLLNKFISGGIIIGIKVICIGIKFWFMIFIVNNVMIIIILILIWESLLFLVWIFVIILLIR